MKGLNLTLGLDCRLVKFVRWDRGRALYRQPRRGPEQVGILVGHCRAPPLPRIEPSESEVKVLPNDQLVNCACLTNLASRQLSVLHLLP